MDKILIEGLRVFAFHGVNPEETALGQWFEVDAVLCVDLSVACRSDRVEDTVSYAKVMKTIVKAMTEQNYRLIERAAQATADAVFDQYPKVDRLRITVKKPGAPVAVPFGSVSVTLARQRPLPTP